MTLECPPIGYFLSGVDFAKMKILLRAADEPNKITEVAIRYGNFINVLFQFVIVAFCIFLIVKVINNMRREEQVAPSAPPAPTREEALLIEIRDALTSQRKE
jgi:large conductance mechanosensitive channel